MAVGAAREAWGPFGFETRPRDNGRPRVLVDHAVHHAVDHAVDHAVVHAVDHAVDHASRPCRRLTRALDVIVAGTGLILTAPVLIGIAFAIRASSRGPVLFRQLRLGRDLEPFHCLKFRTMHRDAERIGRELRRSSAAVEAEMESFFKLHDDPRVTRVGRMLRRTSLDELPQLINVLRGDMSLVGPRPIVAEEGQKYGPRLRLVLSERPGMTGAWQVSGRNKIAYPERVDIDVEYVTRKSLLGDIAILLKTPAAVLDWDATS